MRAKSRSLPLLLALVATAGCGVGIIQAHAPGSEPAVVAPAQQPPRASPTMQPSEAARRGPTIASCPFFPPDHAYNRDVSKVAVHPRSREMLALMNAGARNLHPGFGSNLAYGIPFRVVPAVQPLVPMEFRYLAESDPGPYPFPEDLSLQSDIGGSDRHAIVVQEGTCMLYETWDTTFTGPGWRCGAGAKWDLRSGAPRPSGWTSANAAGLPELAGLVRYDEVAAGEILHALNFTSTVTGEGWVAPATHGQGTSGNSAAPVLGMRARLRADFDRSKFHGQARVILDALARYGMFLTDVGTDFVMGGSSDKRFDAVDLDQLKRVPGDAFEFLDTGAVVDR
jgi:hypothetical protein